MSRRLARGLRYLVFLGVAVLLPLEALTRWLELAPPLPSGFGELEADAVLPFRMRAHSVRREKLPRVDFEYEVRTNSMGFRDVEHAVPKPDGVFRILGLGDSFTMGQGARFEDSYLYRLEQLLAEGRHGAPRIEIVKAGQPRYWPEPQRILLERVGAELEPDLVLVGFTPNDVTDTFIGAGYLGVREGYLVSREADALGRPGLWLYLHSHVARIALRAFLDRRTAASRGRGAVSDIVLADLFRDDGYHEPDWRSVERELGRMREVAGQLGARLVLVHIPFRVPHEPSAYPGERLSRWGARHGVPVVDTYPALRAAAERMPVYWERDIHCNANGYRVIAETLARELRARGLVPTGRASL